MVKEGRGMAAGQLNPVLRYLRKVTAGGVISLTDGELLARFTADRDEAAFTALVRRHGPMVLAVCRRVLGDRHAAEDAAQAAFIVLARKGASLRHPGSLAPWLHGVAYRTAAKVRSESARRRKRERRAGVPRAVGPNEDLVWRDLRPVLDAEIDRLPARYREPFVLCYLEEKTNAEAARLLSCSRGTVATLLARARERLRFRLARRGVTLSAGALAAVLAQNAAPATAASCVGPFSSAALLLAGKAVNAGARSARAAGIAEGVLKAMFLKKLKTTAVVLLLIGSVGAGTGRLMRWAKAESPPAHPARAAQQVNALKDAAAAPPRPRWENAIEEKLKMPITLDFKETSVRQVIADLRSWTGLNLVADSTALQKDGLSEDAVVTIRLENVSLKHALNLILEQNHMTYLLRKNLVLVTSQRAVSKPISKTYLVADLVGRKRGGKDQALVRMITTWIEPRSWSTKGGPGTIEFSTVESRLTVTNWEDVHDRIQAFLDDLRTFKKDDKKN